MIKKVNRYLILLTTLGQLLPIRSFAMNCGQRWEYIDESAIGENVLNTEDKDFFRGGLKNMGNSCYVNTALQILSQDNGLVYQIATADASKLKGSGWSKDKIEKFKAVQFYFHLILTSEGYGKQPYVSRANYVAILKQIGHKGQSYEVESILSAVFEGLRVCYDMDKNYRSVQGNWLDYIPVYLKLEDYSAGISLAGAIHRELGNNSYKTEYLRFDFPLIPVCIMATNARGPKPCLKQKLTDFENLFISVGDDKKGIYVQGKKKVGLLLELKTIAINTAPEYNSDGHWISISRHRSKIGVITYWLHNDDIVKKLDRKKLEDYLEKCPLEGMSFYYSIDSRYC